MTPPSLTETLLAKLAQLAGFGLSAEGQPILTDDRPARGAVVLEHD